MLRGSIRQSGWSGRNGYRLIQDGSYCRAAPLAMEKFYGIPRLESAADAQALTVAMRKANTAGLYKRVLKDACRIRIAMNFGDLADDPAYFARGHWRGSRPYCSPGNMLDA